MYSVTAAASYNYMHHNNADYIQLKIRTLWWQSVVPVLVTDIPTCLCLKAD